MYFRQLLDKIDQYREKRDVFHDLMQFKVRRSSLSQLYMTLSSWNRKGISVMWSTVNIISSI